MNQTILNATWRVETMVGREDELHKIKQAIYEDTASKCCRVVLVKGPGGIGKSRLLEEVQWRSGHPQVREEASSQHYHQAREDWTGLGHVVVSDVVDLMDIRLSARTQLVQALRNALSWQGGVDFRDFESAARGYLRALEGSADFKTIKSRAAEAEEAFWKGFSEHAQQERIVLILDTAERLVLRSSQWLLDRDLLKDEELADLSSQQWLLQQIRQGRFSNTTLIIAGRDGENEGKLFFDQIRKVVKSPETPCSLTEIALGPLTAEETVLYFRYAAKEWTERAGAENQSEYHPVSQAMQDIVADLDGLNVLYEVTGGKPVLLSLYGDLIHEPDPMPPLLQKTHQEIVVEMKRRGEELWVDFPEGKQTTIVCELGREALQAEIERSFLDVLFQKPGLRSEIMQALARCPAGLNDEQLHFLLDSNGNGDLTTWRPNPLRLEAIQNELEHIRRFSIARPRPNGRLGLQDEIYRIYAQRMGETEELKTYESVARKRQYTKLSNWADHALQKLKDERRRYQEEDERRLAQALHSPSIALRPYLPSPTATEQEERSRIQQAIRDWELERLHYDLLRVPEQGLNDSYTDLSERRWLSNVEEEDFIAQQELWRVLYDPYALSYTDLSKDKLAVLRRAARDEDPARWIKRFALRREYARAIEFCDKVEKAILIEDAEARRTWLHPLNRGERFIWKSYAQIMLGGPNIGGIVGEMKSHLAILLLLAAARLDEPIGPQGETGFQGHVALPRLHRIIAVGYNFAGYGRVVLGQYGKGVGNYTRSLVYMRATKSQAQQAGTRNNLGRALASLGQDEHGYRVCMDSLALRRELGAEIPIAYSLNTLALIGNGMQRTPTAWREAAQAAAIFRRAGDSRGLGLALIQLGIGLRRLANSQEPTAIMEALPEELYTIAQRALGEALDIFEKDPEVLRHVEARIEYGCVLRDQMRLSSMSSKPERLSRIHRDAEIEYERAIQLAEEKGFKHLALQARVDLAWAHFYADQLSKAELEASKAEGKIDRDYIITADHFPSQRIDESYVYYQLAKLQGLSAAIGMKRFRSRREQIRQANSLGRHEVLYAKITIDDEATKWMAASARAYVLSLAYGRLYSPRSRSLTITYDQIYDHLKKFNPVEYRMFRKAVQKAQEEFQWAVPSSDITGRNLSDFTGLDEWLEDCFGPLEVRT